MKWQRGIDQSLAVVTCPNCEREHLERPTFDGEINDRCHCGRDLTCRLNGWRFSVPRTVLSLPEWNPALDGPGNTSRT